MVLLCIWLNYICNEIISISVGDGRSKKGEKAAKPAPEKKAPPPKDPKAAKGGKEVKFIYFYIPLFNGNGITFEVAQVKRGLMAFLT